MIAGIMSFIKDLGYKEFYRYVILFFTLFLALIGVLIYVQYRKISSLQDRLKHINQQREEVRTILQEHALVTQQRASVNALLEQSKNFRIGDFFDQALKELGLLDKLSQKRVNDSDLDNGYTESQLDSSFKDLDMRQVVELLYKIEQNSRVYTKELVLIKPPKSSKLDVSLIIATLQPKTPLAP